VLDKMSMPPSFQEEWRQYQQMLPKAAEDLQDEIHTTRPEWLPQAVMWLGGGPEGWKLPSLIPATFGEGAPDQEEEQGEGVGGQAEGQASGQGRADVLEQEEYREQLAEGGVRQQRRQAAARAEDAISCIKCGSGV
jgi:hypothetical protein